MNKHQPSHKNTLSIDDALLPGKAPPQAPDIEAAVLGAVLLEREAQETVFEIIARDDVFYTHTHQRIYRTILALHAHGAPIDLVTVTEQLRRTNELELIGGAGYLTRLTMAVLTSAHVATHARLLYEKYMLRQLITIGASMVADAYNAAADPFDLLDAAQASLQTTADIPGANHMAHIGHYARRVMDDVYRSRAAAGHITGIATGYDSMNRKMYGWQNTDLTILAARPAVGKTAFALNLAFNAAATPGRRVHVAIFSLEMSGVRVTKRAVAFNARIDLGDINRPKDLSDAHLQRMATSVADLARKHIYIDETALLTTTAMKSKLRKLMRQVSRRGATAADGSAMPDEWLVLVDYLQLITPRDPRTIREQQVAQISRDLKLMAKDLNIPIIALSQLNRTGSEHEEPDLKHLRESGAIEQDADNIMFLFKPSPALLAEDPAYYADKIILKGAKFRDGEPFLLPLQFLKSWQLFQEPERFGAG